LVKTFETEFCAVYWCNYYGSSARRMYAIAFIGYYYRPTDHAYRITELTRYNLLSFEPTKQFRLKNSKHTTHSAYPQDLPFIIICSNLCRRLYLRPKRIGLLSAASALPPVSPFYRLS